MKHRTNIPFGGNPACPLVADTGDDGAVTIKDTNGCPLFSLRLGDGVYGLRLENTIDFEWEIPRKKIEDLESLVIREALRFVDDYENGQITRENLKEMVAATGDAEPALALRFIEAKTGV